MNASNSQKLALPKPRKRVKPVKRLRAKSRPRAMSATRRKEAALVAKVFTEIEPRDGHCVIATRAMRMVSVGDCEGDSTPMHIGEWRRFNTRRQAPEARHSRTTIARGCVKHHNAYDAHEWDLSYDGRGADGPLAVVPYVKKGAAA